MKVKRVWECECGATKLVAPVSDSNSSLIIKGDGFTTIEAVSHTTTVICRQCSRKYQILGPVISISRPKRLWECGCGKSSAVKTLKGAILLRGAAIAYGYPTTHIRCSHCPGSYRVAPDIKLASHMAMKAQKRSNSKANRRAKRGR